MAVKKEEAIVAKPQGRYTEGIGRRKTAVARVRITKGEGSVTVNGKNSKIYFQSGRLQEVAVSPLTGLKIEGFDIQATVKGGGVKAQAEAVRHGLARALVLVEESFKKQLRGLGYLTRDPRMVERKKYGLKKARRAPQWKKR